MDQNTYDFSALHKASMQLYCTQAAKYCTEMLSTNLILIEVQANKAVFIIKNY